MKEALKEKLDNCQKDMETLFEDLGKVYSRLMNEISNKTTTAESIIEEYRHKITSKDQNNISTVVRFLEENVQYLTESLNSIDNKLSESMDILSKNLKQFHDVEMHIFDIKESSELMELMALNSMVVAIKAGSKGGGFTYITEVLRKNATSTIQLTEELQDLGLQLKDNLGDLHNLMSELNTQRRAVEEKEGIMRNSFEQFHQSMEKFINFLNDLSLKSSDVRKQVLNISQEISHQDLYRQSLDHVSILLDNIKEPETLSGEEKLDQLTYMEFVAKFSNPLIHEVVTKLDRNIHTFKNETEGIDGSLKKIETERSDYIEQNSNPQNYNEGCCIFQNLTLLDRDLHNLIDSVSRFIREIEEISKTNRGVVDRIINLNERNLRFERILKAFRNVIIMGRIEVTKHEALKGVDVSVNDIAKITDTIEEKVQKIDESIEMVMHFNQNIVNSFQSVNSQINQFIESFKDKLDHFRSMKSESYKVFNKTMNTLNFYPNEYRDYFSNSLNAAEDLGTLSRDLLSLSETMVGFEGKVKENKSTILKEMGLEKWDIKNENINEILSRFTIFSQKNLALKLSGETDLDNESASESSITLF